MTEEFSKSGWGGARPNSGGARAGAGRRRKLALDPAPAFERLRWFCVRTQPRMNYEADIAVRLLGFQIFNPSIFVPGRPARRAANGAMRKAIPERIEPMFGRFFFVLFDLDDGAWRDIVRAESVHSLIGAEQGGRPWPIPNRQIENVRGLLEPNGCLYPRGYSTHRHQSPDLVGTHQRLLTGVLEGEAGICEWSEAKRIRLLMRMFGRDNVPVTVTRDDTETLTGGEALAA